jgi:hypothetical protein
MKTKIRLAWAFMASLFDFRTPRLVNIRVCEYHRIMALLNQIVNPSAVQYAAFKQVHDQGHWFLKQKYNSLEAIVTSQEEIDNMGLFIYDDQANILADLCNEHCKRIAESNVQLPYFYRHHLANEYKIYTDLMLKLRP